MSVNKQQTDIGELKWVDTTGEVMEMGRGDTDTDITFIKLFDSAGTASYIYPATGGTSITVSTTKP